MGFTSPAPRQPGPQNNTTMPLPDRMKERRRLLNLTQEELGRLVGAATVTIAGYERGIIWPKEAAPYEIHLISLNVNKEAEKIYKDLKGKGFDVLYDDRDLSAGEKFADSDLIGIPIRLVVSDKTVKAKAVEMKVRGKDKAEIVKNNNIYKKLGDLLDK